MVRLGDVAEINPSLPQSLNGNAPHWVSFLPMSAVREDGSFTPTERPFDQVRRGYTYFAPGDVLIAKITPCMENGKAAYIAELPHAIGFASTEFHVLRPRPEVDGGYLFHSVWNTKFRHAAERNMTGTAGQKRVPAAFLQRFTIPLPPLAEQKHIAAILDKADAIRRKRQQALQLADEFLGSLFLDMFGDPVENPKQWPTKKLGDVIASIDAGTSTPGEDRQPTEREFAVLKVSAVTSGVFKPFECKVVPADCVPQKRIVPMKGDLLFSRANTRELVAASCLVEDSFPNLFLSDKLWRITTVKDLVLVEYLNYLISNPRFRWTLAKTATGTSGSMLNISQQKLLKTNAPIPPIDTQRKFTSLARRMRMYTQSAASLQKLENSIGACLRYEAFTTGL